MHFMKISEILYFSIGFMPFVLFQWPVIKACQMILSLHKHQLAIAALRVVHSRNTNTALIHLLTVVNHTLSFEFVIRSTVWAL